MFAPWDRRSGLVLARATHRRRLVRQIEAPICSGVRDGRRVLCTYLPVVDALEGFSTAALRGLPLLLAAYLALYPGLGLVCARILAPAQSGRTVPNSWRNLGLGTRSLCLDSLGGFAAGCSAASWNSLGVALHRDLPMIRFAGIHWRAQAHLARGLY